MAASEIGVIRTLFEFQTAAAGWAEQQARIDEVGSVWPVAADVELASVDFGGIPGEWSIVPGSETGTCCSSFTAGAIVRARCAATARCR